MDAEKTEAATPEEKAGESGFMIGAFVGLMIGAMVFGCLGHGCATSGEQAKAIERGVGRWEVSPKRGTTWFIYGADSEKEGK